MLLLFFFFFKQKTAYELRISDWSSDVCSSDLTTQRGKRGGWSSGSDAKSSGGEVRLGRSGDSHFYADTAVDGTNIRMMVDSGASIVALTRRDRSEERRVGKEWVRTCRTRWEPYP